MGPGICAVLLIKIAGISQHVVRTQGTKYDFDFGDLEERTELVCTIDGVLECVEGFGL